MTTSDKLDANGTSVAETRSDIRRFLSRSFRSYSFQDGENIFASGFVNSMFAIQLVIFVETRFAIAVENEDLEIENFSSIDAICRFVERKTGLSS